MRAAAGITRRTRFHDIRHKAITDFFELGFNIPEIAIMSGHRDWQTLKRYTHTKAAGVHASYANLTEEKNGEKSINESIALLAALMAEQKARDQK
ncbi:hypothetical protein D9M71_798830 [compost metagenome]